jgi:hypothetical protein
MDREQAIRQFRSMSMQDCMKMWNEKACDHYCRYVEMHKMAELGWWDRLAEELGAWDMLLAVLNGGENFNVSDMYFFYDEECGHMRSFSTKQELTEQIGTDFFIENLMNEED